MADDPTNQTPERGLIGAAYVAGAGMLIPNTIPLLLGIIGDRFHAGLAQLGLVNSVYTLGSFLASVSAPWWVSRVNSRFSMAVASALLIGGFLAVSRAPDIQAMYVMFALAGVLCGLLVGPSNARLGNSTQPARWFGISMMLQMGTAALFLVMVPAIVQPRFGAAAGLTVLAVLFVPCLLSAGYMGGSIGKSRQAAVDAVPAHLGELGPFLAAFAGFALFVAGGTTFWIFLERIGSDFKLDPVLIGTTLALANAGGVVGGLAVSAAGPRLVPLILLTVPAAVGAYVLTLTGAAWEFVAGAILFNVAWGVGYPSFFHVIRLNDPTRRLFVAAPAAVFGAAALVSPAAGWLAERMGYRLPFLLAGTCFAGGLLIAAWCARRARRAGLSATVAVAH